VTSLAGAQPALEDAGVCARCHGDIAGHAATSGGHEATLPCGACHADRRPGRFGRRHRRTARCKDCHDAQTRHPPRAHRAARATRNCLGCHDPHGSANLSLISAKVRARPRRLAPIVFVNDSGATAGGFTDPDSPGKGLCEACHRKTRVYRADGRGEPHFAETCTQCHDHAGGFQPIVTQDNCTICHGAEGARFAKPSAHSATFPCGDCHTEVSPGAGPGHRAVPTCESCHVTPATHAPPGVGGLACTQCHDAHGSDNIDLVLETIVTPQAGPRPIRFDNRDGMADGSFASASAPGTGICEVCHTATQFYRADGAGQPHPVTDCAGCHQHTEGFGPLVSEATCTICHTAEGARFAKASAHNAIFPCGGCHTEMSPAAGPGHRAVPACESCHTTTATHIPPGAGALPCTQCHDPHGTDNIELVLETITTPQAGPRPIVFDTRDGRADGSFASLSAPGTGVCEVCHTATQFYRADGAGQPHFTLPCYPCHEHTAGFIAE
jgi:predicted CXXCH cytochrome family protein